MNTHSPTLLESIDASAPRATLLARLGRRLILARLREFTRGQIRLIDGDGSEHLFGRKLPDFDVACTLHMTHPQVYADVAFGGTVGAGEAYIRGLWHCDDLTALVRIFVAN